MPLFNFLKKKQAGIESETPVFLFNTLTKQKEQLQSIRPGEVTLYTCGPTVYDYATIGNLRSYIFADILKKTLILNGYKVKHTINLTDFGHLTSDADEGEDKMMTALKREKKPITLSAMRDVADIYIETFKEDIDELNIARPTQFTRASDYIKEQVALIKTLVHKGYTYETSDGVYFDISKFPTYGKLGNIDLQKLKDGARVEINPEKRHPADFALWKKGLLGWESDWGKGFPGWHIECTAMVFASLGKQIDIHTGGIDHIATHHNGEIAQAEAATGKQYVRYWMHNAFITIEGKRIGKSEGNAIVLRQLRERGYPGDVYRYWLLGGHYRTQMNFTFEALDGAKQALYRLKRYMFEEYLPANAVKKGAVCDDYQQHFIKALNDDLDTPKAIALVWELIKDTTVTPSDKAVTLKSFDSVLDIGLRDEPDAVIRELGILEESEIPEDIQKLLEERELARVARNWSEADRLREALNLRGYTVVDTANGPRVSKVQ